MATTLTAAIHKNQNPNETMTQCLARLRDKDETMTHEARDLAIIADGGGPVVPPVVTKPKPVTKLIEQVHVSTDTTLGFAWDASTGATKYTLSVTPAVAGFPKDTNQTEMDLTGLTAATEYTFSVKACNTAGCSANVSKKATTKATVVVTAPKATTPKPKVP